MAEDASASISLNIAFSRLVALRKNIPGSISEAFVREYHEILDSFEQHGLPMKDFRIRQNELHDVTLVRNLRTGKRTESLGLHVDGNIFLSRFDAALIFIERLMDVPKKGIGFSEDT